MFDRSQLNILPLSERQHKMTVEDIYPLDAKTPTYENENLNTVAEGSHLDDGRTCPATRKLTLYYRPNE